MAATDRTPAPWGANTRQGSWDWVIYCKADPNIEVCQMFHDGTELNPTGEANAALVAVAPELLEAAIDVCALVDETTKQDSGAYRAFQALEAAIAKTRV